MAERILLVDDEPRVLDGLRRNLASTYPLETALSGPDGLKLLEQGEGTADPFAVVVSDMMMPGMTGAEFLGRVREVAPDAVLMILSGQADLRSTVAAVNNSSLFRFIAKPCSPHQLKAAIEDALGQYRLVHAERELLGQTLAGAVSVLANALALAYPEAGARGALVAGLVEVAGRRLGFADSWELRMAGRLGQLGLVSLPAEVLGRVESGARLTPDEEAMYRAHPSVARKMLTRIPRLERVADWIAAQPTSIDAEGPAPVEVGDTAALQEQIFVAATQFLLGRDHGERPATTAQRLTRTGGYRSEIVQALLEAAAEREGGGELRDVRVAELAPGMVFQHDVVAESGITLVRKGDVLTEAGRLRLQNFAASVGVPQPMRVLVPGT